MILAARFNEESWEKLVEYEKEHEEDPDADLFTKKSGRLLREIAKIDRSSAPKEQTEHMVKALNDLLSIFEASRSEGYRPGLSGAHDGSPDRSNDALCKHAQ